MSDDSIQYVMVSLRIGNGTKIHPGKKSVRYGVEAMCSCPGTQNGHARLSVVAQGHELVK